MIDAIGIVAKIAWAHNRWKGFDEEGFNKKEKYGYKYVNETGIAHEWWNFYERFSNDYYFGHVEQKGEFTHFDQGLIVFISKNINDNKFYFVGFYGEGEYSKNGFSTGKTLAEIIPEHAKEKLKKAIAEGKISPKFAEYLQKAVFEAPEEIKSKFRAKKAYSTVFMEDCYVPVTASDFGISKFGQNNVMYIGENEKIKPTKIRDLLIKAKKRHKQILEDPNVPDDKKEEAEKIVEKIEWVLKSYFPSNYNEGDNMEELVKYLMFQGYYYNPHLVSQFYTALKTKGFVILSGLTGTGKTKIAQELAELTSSIWASELPNVFSKWEETDDEFENALREIQRAIKENGFATLVWGPEGEVRNVEPPFVFWIGHQNKLKAAALVTEKYSAEEALREARELSRGFEWNLGKYNETFESATKDHQSKYGSAVVFKVAEIILLKEPIDASEVFLRVGFKKVAPFKNVKFRDPMSKNFLFLSVRPDWRDSKALLGYYNSLTGEYQRTELLDFLLRALNDYQRNGANAKPYFILLDEMNLAHVEYYFADFLSVLESGRDKNGFTRESIKLHDIYDIAEKQGIPKELKLPPNLYIIGTVNMDETTYTFSPKVLDRAFVVEFHDVDLENYPPANGNLSEDFESLRETLLNDLRGSNGKFLAHSKGEINKAVEELKAKDYWQILQDLNRALEPYDLHFGYRVIDEIALFFKNAKESEENGIVKFESEDEIFDLALLMKVLPKFHGNRKKLEKPLKEVLRECIGSSNEFEIKFKENNTEKTIKLPSQLEKLNSFAIVEILRNWESYNKNFRFKHTAKKVFRMLRQLYEIGFASFS
jgi:5-methylcytosine-specific restriction endonuclease McrBC GTP-binding regulatory subunit McrB